MSPLPANARFRPYLGGSPPPVYERPAALYVSRCTSTRSRKGAAHLQSSSRQTGRTRRSDRRTLLRVALSLVAVLLFLLLAVPSDTFPQARLVDQRVELVTLGLNYNFLNWEASALSNRIVDYVLGGEDSTAALFSESDLVREYFARSEEVIRLTDRASYLASLPADARHELPQVEGELQDARPRLASLEDAAESILARQMSWALRVAGLDVSFLGGRFLWPPVISEFVELPLLLVVSPRDQIKTMRQAFLVPNVFTDQMERMEDRLFQDGWAAMVTQIGGLATYPSMLPAKYGLAFVLEGMPHEWTHDYLVFRPLGWRYGDSGELTTINETLCDLVGKEIGDLVARQFYPEMVRPIEPDAESQVSSSAPPADQFDFGREMRATRLRVDELLAEGRVTEAEEYMEARRQIFVENGYAIRKLNQAYFAFHGSYATGEGSVSPIGPQMKELRKQSPSLRGFVLRVSAMTSYDDLLAALGLPLSGKQRS